MPVLSITILIPIIYSIAWEKPNQFGTFPTTFSSSSSDWLNITHRLTPILTNMDFLDSQRVEFPDLEGFYETFGTYYEKKLWHQLSVALEEFVNVPANNRGTNFRRLYTDFITKFDGRLSPVRLALIISTIGLSLPDPKEALDLFETALKSHAKLNPEATMCLEMDVVLVSLKLGHIERAKELLEGAKSTLATLSSSETVIFSKFYKATAEYRKV